MYKRQPVVQCEIGALVVGGIFNERENTRFGKGMEKGHFELAGSTIILLFEKEQMQLRPELLEKLSQVEEVQVKPVSYTHLDVYKRQG